ncbi:hypothetical protein ACE193_23060 [Bernardetia sp. OM2101]|uniref:hypothetical protein n=1 Tax=Bernardetia sp. OM2101 TaxID=3344876 RepID=UPI0035D050EC
MEDIKKALEALICEEVRINFNEEKKSIKIEEEQNTGSKQLRSVTIKGIDECFLAFKLDHPTNKFLGKLFNEITDLNKACDAIIFCRIRDKNYVFSIELKSNENSGIYQKFRNSQIFIGLINGISKIYFDVEQDFEKDFEAINILFDRKTTDKTIAKKSLKDIEYFHQGLKLQDSLVHIHPFISQQNK